VTAGTKHAVNPPKPLKRQVIGAVNGGTQRDAHGLAVETYILEDARARFDPLAEALQIPVALTAAPSRYGNDSPFQRR
jgi:hypothetical protein